jgi:hypothetical protein
MLDGFFVLSIPISATINKNLNSMKFFHSTAISTSICPLNIQITKTGARYRVNLYLNLFKSIKSSKFIPILIVIAAGISIYRTLEQIFLG